MQQSARLGASSALAQGAGLASQPARSMVSSQRAGAAAAAPSAAVPPPPPPAAAPARARASVAARAATQMRPLPNLAGGIASLRDISIDMSNDELELELRDVKVRWW